VQPTPSSQNPDAVNATDLLLEAITHSE
jgi:hypothetical protein